MGKKFHMRRNFFYRKRVIHFFRFHREGTCGLINNYYCSAPSFLSCILFHWRNNIIEFTKPRKYAICRDDIAIHFISICRENASSPKKRIYKSSLQESSSSECLQSELTRAKFSDHWIFPQIILWIIGKIPFYAKYKILYARS